MRFAPSFTMHYTEYFTMCHYTGFLQIRSHIDKHIRHFQKTYVCSQPHTYTNMHTHKHKHAHTYTHTHMRTHACTRTHTRIYKHTHTHTHTQTLTCTSTHECTYVLAKMLNRYKRSVVAFWLVQEWRYIYDPMP